MIENNFLLMVKNTAQEFTSDILYFPKWLFFEGVQRTLRNTKHWLRWYSQKNSLPTLIKNIGQPMYGQNDWQGRIISFFVRFFHLIALLLGFLCWTIGVLFMMVLWFALPLLLLWEIGYQLQLFPSLFYWL